MSIASPVYQSVLFLTFKRLLFLIDDLAFSLFSVHYVQYLVHRASERAQKEGS